MGACSACVALAAFPFVASEYWLYLACLVAINVASAMGLNILTGYTGLVSLGQAAFMGLGALHRGDPADCATARRCSSTCSAAAWSPPCAGVLVGLPSLRVKGLYLAIATIAAGVLAHFLFSHLPALTGGPAGLSVPPARIFGVELDTSARLYWVIVPITALLLLGAANLFRTRIGRAFIAIRDRDISAEVLGIPLLRYKLLSFAISSFYAGVAGGLFAYFFRAVTPESFPLLMSIFFLAAVIVGGMGTVLGSVLGAVFMTLVPELLKLIVGCAAARRQRDAVALAGAHHRVRRADHRLPDLRAARPGRDVAAHPPRLPPLALPDLTLSLATPTKETSMTTRSTSATSSPSASPARRPRPSRPRRWRRRPRPAPSRRRTSSSAPRCRSPACSPSPASASTPASRTT